MPRVLKEIVITLESLELNTLDQYLHITFRCMYVTDNRIFEFRPPFSPRRRGCRELRLDRN